MNILVLLVPFYAAIHMHINSERRDFEWLNYLTMSNIQQNYKTFCSETFQSINNLYHLWALYAADECMMSNQRALLASYLINQSPNLVNVPAVWTQRAMLRRNLPKLQGRRRNIGSACFNTFPPPGTSWLTRRNSLNNQRLPSKSKSSVSCSEV